MEKMNFICTKDKDTADKLAAAYFTCLGCENGIYKFINDGKAKLSFDDESKIIYTNMLNV